MYRIYDVFTVKGQALLPGENVLGKVMRRERGGGGRERQGERLTDKWLHWTIPDYVCLYAITCPTTQSPFTHTYVYPARCPRLGGCLLSFSGMYRRYCGLLKTFIFPTLLREEQCARCVPIIVACYDPPAFYSNRFVPSTTRMSDRNIQRPIQIRNSDSLCLSLLVRMFHTRFT